MLDPLKAKSRVMVVILYDRFLLTLVDPTIRNPVASKVDSHGASIHPGIHPEKPCYYNVIYGFRGGLRPGWTPKKIALTLAKLRAAPPSIRSAQEGTVKTMT